MGLLSKKRKIAVLRGGFDGRLRSMSAGQEILDVLQTQGEVTLLDVAVIDSGEWMVHGKSIAPSTVLAQVDGVISTIRGRYGEDGQLARDITLFNVPFFGSSSFSTALANNKKIAKDMMKRHGIKTAADFRITNDSVNDLSRMAHTLESLIEPKYIIKPTYGNSGDAIRTANSTAELGRVLSNMVPDYDDVLVEQFIDGKTITCGVMSDFRHQALYTTPTVEIESTNPDIFDPHRNTKLSPARLDRQQKESISEIAKLAHKTLGLKHHSRSDFIVTNDGQIVYLETNSMPSFSSDSPMREGFTVVGVGLDELAAHMTSALTS